MKKILVLSLSAIIILCSFLGCEKNVLSPSDALTPSASPANTPSASPANTPSASPANTPIITNTPELSQTPSQTPFQTPEVKEKAYTLESFEKAYSVSCCHVSDNNKDENLDGLIGSKRANYYLYDSTIYFYEFDSKENAKKVFLSHVETRSTYKWDYDDVFVESKDNVEILQVNSLGDCFLELLIENTIVSFQGKFDTIRSAIQDLGYEKYFTAFLPRLGVVYDETSFRNAFDYEFTIKDTTNDYDSEFFNKRKLENIHLKKSINAQRTDKSYGAILFLFDDDNSARLMFNSIKGTPLFNGEFEYFYNDGSDYRVFQARSGDTVHLYVVSGSTLVCCYGDYVSTPIIAGYLRYSHCCYTQYEN